MTKEEFLKLPDSEKWEKAYKERTWIAFTSSLGFIFSILALGVFTMIAFLYPSRGEQTALRTEVCALQVRAGTDVSEWCQDSKLVRELQRQIQDFVKYIQEEVFSRAAAANDPARGAIVPVPRTMVGPSAQTSRRK